MFPYKHSNDFIIVLSIFHFSAGGLVTAVAPVVVQGNGLWIGWPGVHLEKGEKIPESDPDDTTPTAGLQSDKVGCSRCSICQRVPIVLISNHVFPGHTRSFRSSNVRQLL